MNFQIKNFSTLRIFSNDIQKSRDWYIQFFGLKPIEDLKNFVSFEIENTKLDITAVNIAAYRRRLIQGINRLNSNRKVCESM